MVNSGEFVSQSHEKQHWGWSAEAGAVWYNFWTACSQEDALWKFKKKSVPRPPPSPFFPSFLIQETAFFFWRSLIIELYWLLNNRKSNLWCEEELQTSQLEAKLLARLTTAKFVSAQQGTEDVWLLLKGAAQGCAEPRERWAVGAGAAYGGKPRAHLQGVGNRVCWLSSSDIKVCPCLAKGVCLGRKEPGACPGSSTGAAGSVNRALAIVQWFCLDSGLQNSEGETAAVLLLATSVFLFSVLWAILSTEGKQLGWISLRVIARSVPQEKVRIFP